MLTESKQFTLLTAIGRIAQHAEALGQAKETARTADRYVAYYEQRVVEIEKDLDKAIKGVAWSLDMDYNQVREHIVCTVNHVTVKRVEMLEVVRDLLEEQNMVGEAAAIRDKDEEFVSHTVALECYDLLMGDSAKECADQVKDVLGYKVQPFVEDEFLIHCSEFQWEILRKKAAVHP